MWCKDTFLWLSTNPFSCERNFQVLNAFTTKSLSKIFQRNFFYFKSISIWRIERFARIQNFFFEHCISYIYFRLIQYGIHYEFSSIRIFFVIKVIQENYKSQKQLFFTSSDYFYWMIPQQIDDNYSNMASRWQFSDRLIINFDHHTGSQSYKANVLQKR